MDINSCAVMLFRGFVWSPSFPVVTQLTGPSGFMFLALCCNPWRSDDKQNPDSDACSKLSLYSRHFNHSLSGVAAHRQIGQAAVKQSKWQP
jgi:hypothetical protein